MAPTSQMSDIQRQVTETARSLAEVDARLKHNEKAHKANEVVIKEISGLPEDTPTFLTVGTSSQCAHRNVHAHDAPGGASLTTD